MNKPKAVGTLLWVAGIALVSLPASSQTAATPAATNAPAATPLVPAPILVPTDVITQAESITVRLQTMANEPPTDATESIVNEQLGPFTRKVDSQYDDSAWVLETNPPLDRLRSLQHEWAFLETSPAAWKDDLAKRADALAKTLAELDGQKTKWDSLRQAAAKDKTLPPEVSQRIDAVLKNIADTRKQLADKQVRILGLQDQVLRQEGRVTSMLAAINQARDRAVNRLFEPNVAPIWSSAPAEPARLSPETVRPSDQAWHGAWSALLIYFATQSGRFLIHGAILLVLVVIFYWVRGHAREWSEEGSEIKRAAQIFETPVATAGLLSLLFSGWLYPLAPRLLLALIGAIALVPTVILLRRLLEPRLLPILYALVLFFFVEEFRSVAVLPPPFSRLLFLIEIAAGMMFLLWLLVSRRLKNSVESPQRFSQAIRFGAWIALGFLTLAFVANLFGYVLLANLLCEAVQRSANVAMILYAATRVGDAMVLIFLRLQPMAAFGMVRLHGPALLRRTNRFFAWVAGTLWVLFTLEMFSLRAPVVAWLASLLTFHFADAQGHDHVALTLFGKMLAGGLVIWLAVMLSRLVRSVLQADVFPRLQLAPGLPYAISSVVHYAVLVVAFIAATNVLGIDMTKFTILVSALGVGVGFGLQNIINNFVSGLILLFERPVKIGDSIQVGDSVGVVERIGIRASILRTTAGAEMIVPNGSLISDRVTNWTLSNQERIITIPFNVVGGPNVSHLMELLKKTAASHPKVLKEPPPQVMVLSLGATLSFELRAWTTEMENWNQVRSDLVLEINNALTGEHITMA